MILEKIPRDEEKESSSTSRKLVFFVVIFLAAGGLSFLFQSSSLLQKHNITNGEDGKGKYNAYSRGGGTIRKKLIKN